MIERYKLLNRRSLFNDFGHPHTLTISSLLEVFNAYGVVIDCSNCNDFPSYSYRLTCDKLGIHYDLQMLSSEWHELYHHALVVIDDVLHHHLFRGVSFSKIEKILRAIAVEKRNSPCIQRTIAWDFIYVCLLIISELMCFKVLKITPKSCIIYSPPIDWFLQKLKPLVLAGLKVLFCIFVFVAFYDVLYD